MDIIKYSKGAKNIFFFNFIYLNLRTLLQWGAKVKGGHQHSHLVFQTNRQVRRVQNRHISIIVSIQIKLKNNNK